MNCDRARDLIGAYRDGELPPEDQREMAAHIAGCKACAEIAADDDRIGRAIRGQGRVTVPAGLTARVQHGLEQIEAQPFPATSLKLRSFSFDIKRPRLRSWGPQAAAIAAACLISVGATWWVMSGIGQSDRLEREVLSAHVRSLLQESAVQVASSDQHTVRPWFAGRIDFAPVVKDLKAEGFPLVGGRLDYIADRRVGALVYKRNLHVINVFLWPAAGAAEVAPHLTTRNGYNLMSWSRAGVIYWAASDLNGAELEQLSRLL